VPSDCRQATGREESQPWRAEGWMSVSLIAGDHNGGGEACQSRRVAYKRSLVQRAGTGVATPMEKLRPETQPSDRMEEKP
jgi:hypothetical protein